MPHDHDNEPENYHALYDREARILRGIPGQPELLPMSRGHRRFAAEAPDLTVTYDEAVGSPNQVFRAAPGNRLTRGAADPAAAVLAFMGDRRDLWRLTQADVDALEVVAVSRTGLPTVRLIQRFAGKEVFGSDMTVAVDGSGQVVSASGTPFAKLRSGLIAIAEAERIDARQAIAHALADLTGTAFAAAEFHAAKGNDPASSYFAHKPPAAAVPAVRPELERPPRVKEVIFPVGGDRYVEGFYIELWVKDGPAFAYVIEAQKSDQVLYRKNLRSRLTAFKYLVYAGGPPLFRPEDGPAPGTPHPTGKPDGYQAPVIAQTMVSLVSLLPGDPWLPDGATETRGNNCVAYADLSAGDGLSEGDVLGKVSAPGEFVYAYDHSKGADDANNLQASLVGMFFHVNWLHDRWYVAGFDEASGNAQMDKYGRGGVPGDPILAEGNDFSGTDNANMVTPAEGESPCMQMYVFTGTKPTRTSNFEALITFHELGHYLTNRLIGNGKGLGNRQGQAMGEGWGDFLALCMTSKPGDDFEAGVFAIGGWTDLIDDSVKPFRDNYYFSIRRYPTSADMTKSPLTFKHIGASVALPTGPVRNPNRGGPNNEVHNAGGIWCAMLWEVFVSLVRKHGHREAEERMLKLVIGGLKLTPNNPTFTQARDAIIAAANVLFPGDLGELWAAFAKRGIGAGAVSPRSDSIQLTGVVESFGVPELAAVA